MKKHAIISFLFGSLLMAAPLMAQSKAVISSLQARPAQEAMYRLSLEMEHELAANAEIVLELPEVFDLASIKIAGSNEIKGGFTYETEQNRLRLKRTGLGEAVAAGQQVSIVFGPLKNPESLIETLWANIVLPAQANETTTVREQIRFE